MDESKLAVVVNGASILEFDRAKPLPGQQRRALDIMDENMDRGINLGQEHVESPNPMQRAQFVANTLINALFAENYSQAMAMSTYLAKRIPELQQVKAVGNIDDVLNIELVFDRSYEQSSTEQPVQFYRPEKPS
ncbi:hypothetical protein [Leucothrix pacifica]|uniref:Uncharacterized protein n=1 Tax=Leucothrix pacifica TaxID=1247513 RepID=A0A317C5Z8_9GAMM|nr:hypothetical protein [Leucothrix pacifica]PWQ94085.1 hypothetical protein DKW60_17430 [Leucothrix pacifica]